MICRMIVERCVNNVYYIGFFATFIQVVRPIDDRNNFCPCRENRISLIRVRSQAMQRRQKTSRPIDRRPNEVHREQGWEGGEPNGNY